MQLSGSPATRLAQYHLPTAEQMTALNRQIANGQNDALTEIKAAPGLLFIKDKTGRTPLQRLVQRYLQGRDPNGSGLESALVLAKKFRPARLTALRDHLQQMATRLTERMAKLDLVSKEPNRNTLESGPDALAELKLSAREHSGIIMPQHRLIRSTGIIAEPVSLVLDPKNQAGKPAAGGKKNELRDWSSLFRDPKLRTLFAPGANAQPVLPNATDELEAMLHGKKRAEEGPVALDADADGDHLLLKPRMNLERVKADDGLARALTQQHALDERKLRLQRVARRVEKAIDFFKLLAAPPESKKAV